jgi:hypothetical protein
MRPAPSPALTPLSEQGCPIDVLSNVFDAVEALLRFNPTFQAVTNTFRAWNGAADDAVAPNLQDMPWCRITPLASEMVMGDEIGWSVEFKIMYELATEGLNRRDLLNYFGCLRQAMNFQATAPQSLSALSYLRNSGLTIWTFTQGATGPQGPPPLDGKAQLPTFFAAKGVMVGKVYTIV